MPWTNQGGGGPWGGGGSGGGGPGPWGRGPSGPQQPPNLEDIVRKIQDLIRRWLPGGGRNARVVPILVLVAIGLWLLTGFYRVQPDEQGVALILGRWVATTGPGLNYNLPAPIGHVYTPKVTRVNQVEIGFRSGAEVGRPGAVRDVEQESLMLTGDENIIDIKLVVFWIIKDAGQFLFNIRNPEGTVKDASEAALRAIIGETNFELAYTQGRKAISVEAPKVIQQILDSYGSGIQITQVALQAIDPPKEAKSAFVDVQTARADKERAMNEAQGYLNEVTQKAQGQAEQVVKAADAYKAERINQANGDAQRFLAILQQYQQNKDITTRRVYLDTMEKVLGGINKVLIEKNVDGTGVLPYLPLNDLIKHQQPPQPQQQKGAQQ
jgi:membrane protease subunit HflK